MSEMGVVTYGRIPEPVSPTATDIHELTAGNAPNEPGGVARGIIIFYTC